MNLLLLEKSEIDPEGRVELSDRRAEHLLRILRVEADRTLRVAQINGPSGVGRVVAVGETTVELVVDLHDPPISRPPLDLIVALPRPQALKRVLQYGATMSVRRIALIRSWRVEKSFFQTPLLAPEALRRQLILGAEQGMSSHLPEVTLHHRFAAFLDTVEPDSSSVRLLAHPGAPEAIESTWHGLSAERRTAAVELALGPEGGWLDREVESFRQAGFRGVTLGPWVLRVETALAAAIAQIELLRRLP
jgi:16S rRNA (uracil1498-N3)-methyltransferase